MFIVYSVCLLNLSKVFILQDLRNNMSYTRNFIKTYVFRLVDSRDITELKLKQMDCELIIRKKEAFAPAPSAAPVVVMQPPQQPMFPPQPAISPQPTPAAAPPSAPTPAPPSPSKGSTSSLPPLKCPMAGTFYCCPAPGEPPFVKVLFRPKPFV